MSQYELSPEERTILAQIEQDSAQARAEHPLDQRPRATTDNFPIGVSDDGRHVFGADAGILPDGEDDDTAPGGY